jgi:rhamnopyranosyl-N-acetylglucosaminyl-diphospho-decaprenol beta-1,3/1,4-galactofuranosyltransferase
MDTVCAVIVTHNRRELLRDALAAVGGQTRPPDHVLVVDNSSDDGTGEMLRREHPDVEVVRLDRNEGSAGGFHEGIARAHSAGHELIWVMDDDTVPSPEALKALLDARRDGAGRDAALLASKIVWSDGTLHPMNRPLLAWKQVDRLIGAAESGGGLIPLRAATFPSLLLHRRAIEAHGLPDKSYFLWSDDLEYTARILQREPGFLVTGSVALHKTPSAHTALTSAGERYYFHVRNTVYMLRGGAWDALEKASLARNLLGSVAQFLSRERWRPHAFGVVARGLRDGLVPPRDPAGPYAR